MTRAAILGLVALTLAVGLAWQNWPEAVPPAPTAPPEAPAPAPLAVLPGSEALRAHPLFSPSRLPPPAAQAAPEVAVPAPAVTVAEAPPAPLQAPVLQGLVLTPTPGAAYLGDPATGQSFFLRPGQSALGLTLQSVEPGAARFKGAEGEVVLSLTRAPPEVLPEVSPGVVPPTDLAPQMPEVAPPTARAEGTSASPEEAAAPSPDVLPPDAFAPVQEPP